MGNYMVKRYLRAVDKIDTNEAISCYMRQFYARLLPGHKVELVYGNDSHLFEKGKEGALTVKMQSMDMFAADRTAIQENTAHYFANV